MLLLAGEVGFALDGAVVLALGLLEDDANPFSGGKLCHADKGHLTYQVLLFDLDPLAEFDGRHSDNRLMVVVDPTRTLYSRFKDL